MGTLLRCLKYNSVMIYQIVLVLKKDRLLLSRIEVFLLLSPVYSTNLEVLGIYRESVRSLRVKTIPL